MIYYKKDNGMVYKYSVLVSDDLGNVLTRIVFDCGEVKFNSYDTEYLGFNDKFIADYSFRKIGTKEYFEEVRDVYHVEYNEYVPGILASKIIAFIKDGDMDLLDFLDNPNSDLSVSQSLSLEKAKLNVELATMLNDIFSNNENISFSNDSKEIMEYKKMIELNKDRKLESDYIDEVKGCFNFKCLDVMPEDEVLRVVNFLDINDKVPNRVVGKKRI